MDLERRIELLVERFEPTLQQHPFLSRWFGMFLFLAPFKGADLLVDAAGGPPWRFEGPWWAFFVSLAFVSLAWAFFLMPLRTPEVGAAPKEVLTTFGPQYFGRWLAGSVFLFFAGTALVWANYGSPADHDSWVIGLIAPFLLGAVYLFALSCRLILAWLQQPRRRRG